MNTFEAVKNTVTARQAAEHYGIKGMRKGMACCPFHRDRHPSMKLDQRFHRFGCQTDWFDGKKIDEIALCEYLLRKKERKCIHGRLCNLDGEIGADL